jgi:hypothetical protein
MLVHIIPFDKFIYSQTIAIREANKYDFVIAVGKPSRKMDISEIEKLLELNNIIYVQRRGLFKSTLCVIRILYQHKDKAALVVHGMDLLYVKYICLFCLLARIHIYWHVRGTDLYRHLQDSKLPRLHRALNYMIIPRVKGYMSSTALDGHLVKCVFGNNNFINMIASPSSTLPSTDFSSRNSRKPKRALVGNSATWTSNIDLFLKLYPAVIECNPDIDFVLQIAYGSEKVQSAIHDQISLVRSVTLNKRFMTLYDYQKYVANFEHAILMPSRMQGVGLLLTLISSGVTIHTPHFLPLAEFLRQYEFIFKDLNQSGQKLLSLTEEEHSHNRSIVETNFSRHLLVNQWRKLVNKTI